MKRRRHSLLWYEDTFWIAHESSRQGRWTWQSGCGDHGQGVSSALLIDTTLIALLNLLFYTPTQRLGINMLSSDDVQRVRRNIALLLDHRHKHCRRRVLELLMTVSNMACHKSVRNSRLSTPISDWSVMIMLAENQHYQQDATINITFGRPDVNRESWQRKS